MAHATQMFEIPRDELEFTFARSGGPGGQNVNKVNSKATLRWNARRSPSLPEDVRLRFLAAYRSRVTAEGEILITSQRFRDQARNIEDCLGKLRSMLAAVEKAPRKRKATKPTRGSRERRLREKQAGAERKRLRSAPRRDD